MSFLQRWWWILLLGPIAAAIPAAYMASRSEAVYESTAVVLVISDNGLEASERLTNTYGDLVTLRPVISGVKSRLGLNLTEEEIARKIDVSSDFNSQLISIKVRDADPRIASSIANTTAATFVERTNSQLARPALDPATLPPGTPPSPPQAPNVRIVEDAIPPQDPSKPSVPINAALAAGLGLLVAASIGIALDSLWPKQEEPGAVSAPQAREPRPARMPAEADGATVIRESSRSHTSA